MLQIFKTMADRYNRYATFLGRKRACEVLLNSSDRMLEDAGFSRELLEQGVAAWPWLRTQSDQDLQPLDLQTSATRAAIKELQSYSEAELLDLGLTRGTITQAVLRGREGIDNLRDRKAA
ncbi:MAG: hypothetical protein AB8B64_25655 [Granulosicoccus sp.]